MMSTPSKQEAISNTSFEHLLQDQDDIEVVPGMDKRTQKGKMLNHEAEKDFSSDENEDDMLLMFILVDYYFAKIELFQSMLLVMT